MALNVNCDARLFEVLRLQEPTTIGLNCGKQISGLASAAGHGAVYVVPPCVVSSILAELSVNWAVVWFPELLMENDETLAFLSVNVSLGVLSTTVASRRFAAASCWRNREVLSSGTVTLAVILTGEIPKREALMPLWPPEPTEVEVDQFKTATAPCPLTERVAPELKDGAELNLGKTGLGRRPSCGGPGAALLAKGGEVASMQISRIRKLRIPNHRCGSAEYQRSARRRVMPSHADDVLPNGAAQNTSPTNGPRANCNSK